jgi:acyl-CoA reductase-like NAD-dependent aldehyde dehydrogenase
MAPTDRATLLNKLADLIDVSAGRHPDAERNANALADLEALDNGKPAKMALWVDVATAVKLLRYYAGWCDKIEGKTVPGPEGMLTFTKYQPLGKHSRASSMSMMLLGLYYAPVAEALLALLLYFTLCNCIALVSHGWIRMGAGVVAAILPFNFPMLGAVCKLAPALAAGNTIVIKSSEKTPLGALFLADLVKQVGFPPGTIL